MSIEIFKKTYAEPEFSLREALRYSGCKEADEITENALKECLEEAKGKFIYKVCWKKSKVSVSDDECRFEQFCVHSKALAKNLSGCSEAIIFAATVGIEIDRLIARYSRVSPAKAVLFQAIGAERIEALCDEFAKERQKEFSKKLRPRFSPGYGDVGLSVQKDIFLFLDLTRQLNIYLNDSLLMSPSKSVTAFIGIPE